MSETRLHCDHCEGTRWTAYGEERRCPGLPPDADLARLRERMAGVAGTLARCADYHRQPPLTLSDCREVMRDMADALRQALAAVDGKA